MSPPSPMMAVVADEAFDDPAWVFEPKWDGVRAVLEVDEQGARLWSRNGNEISAAYPELTHLAHELAPGTIIDGEIVAFREGRPSFERLQGRMHLRDARRVRQAAVENPVVYMVFDVLADGGEDTTALPLSERRDRLERIVPTGDTVQLSPQTPGAGIALFDAVQAQHLEGIVAKRLDSRYTPGRRSATWQKIKVVHDVDVVVAGWRPGGGNRVSGLGSLVTALYDGGDLRYVGSVGSGFDRRSLAAMEELLELVAGEIPPIDPETVPDAGHVRWSRPELVAIVEYREVTSAGHLRAPVFKGMRADKDPTDCTVEQLS